jgi:hypothetical protein
MTNKKELSRIEKNEELLNDSLSYIKNLKDVVDNYHLYKEKIDLLNKYYGSKEWFKDKEKYEKGIIKDINAGVLSEDSVWNLNEDFSDLIEEMKNIIIDYSNNK